MLPRSWSPTSWLLLCAALGLPAYANAQALAPSDVFARVRPSVVVVEVESAGVPTAGTAIALGGSRFATACSLLAGADAIHLAVEDRRMPARLLAQDPPRNACLLDAPGAPAVPALARAPWPQAGERVFAVSNALGLGVGVSEGVVAGVRTRGDATLIQFSAPVSPGSEGGALVDAQGRLVGLIDHRRPDGQNVNFAVAAAALDGIEARRARDGRPGLRDEATRALRAGDGARLGALADAWVRDHANDVDGRIWQALAARLRGDLDAEERAWRAARDIDSGPATGAGLVGVLLRQRRAAEAGALAQSLLAVQRDDAAMWTLLGAARHGAGDAAGAEHAYRQALALDGWAIAAHEGLAALSRERADHAGAARIWAALARRLPQDAQLRWRQVDSHLAAGDAVRAWSVLEGLPAAMAASADGRFWRARTLDALRRPLDAIAAMRDSLRLGPSDASLAWRELGRLYHGLHRFPEAIAAHREAVRLAPGAPDRRFWLAVALKDGGHVEQALAIDRELVAEWPHDARAWRQLGMASAVARRTDDSIAALERSLSIDAQQARLWTLLLQQYRAAGRQADVMRAYGILRAQDAAAAERAYRWAIAPDEPSPGVVR